MALDGDVVVEKAMPLEAGWNAIGTEAPVKSVPRAAPRKHTLTILDWDDTILSSTHLFAEEKRAMQSNEAKASEEFSAQMTVLESRALVLLEEARKYGDVIIITNAEAGWVELSASQFMPNVAAYLQHCKIPVISARSRSEGMFPSEPMMWKASTFWCVVTSLYSNPQDLNLLVIGDGAGERVAAQLLQLNLPKAVVKTLMLLPSPSTAQLTEELKITAEHFEDFVYLEKGIEANLF
ncbi:hypothetical protein NDN08_003992 [Rhodosorus marinus]|uniref:Uncharacterized protein n=1 Tax=Rhodosorus marinus TaxID=101924 RepID=A0AAV8UJZ3_9RHOD|nr:hypothetical protein NDN08_003992 [Rhodosorus marinus]